MAINTEQIQHLLGTGLSNEVVASAVGVDPSYISQLMADEAFASVVIEKRSKALTANTQRDTSIDALEDRIISKLGQVLDYIVKPEQLLAAFRTINNAKRRGVPANQQLTNRTTVVALSLPPAIKKQFTLSQQSEIIDVEGQTLVTMGSVALLNKLKEERGSDGARYGKLAEQISKEELPQMRGTQSDRAAFRKLIEVDQTQNANSFSGTKSEGDTDVSIEDL